MKKKYDSPRLTPCGDIRTLTLSKNGTDWDGQWFQRDSGGGGSTGS